MSKKNCLVRELNSRFVYKLIVKSWKGEDSTDYSVEAGANQEHSLHRLTSASVLPRSAQNDRQIDYPVKELEAALHSLKAVFVHLNRLSNETAEDDPYKKPLCDLTQQLDTGLEHTHQAKQAIAKRQKGSLTLVDDSLGLSSGVRKRGYQGLDKADERKEHVKAKST